MQFIPSSPPQHKLLPGFNPNPKQKQPVRDQDDHAPVVSPPASSPPAMSAMPSSPMCPDERLPTMKTFYPTPMPSSSGMASSSGLGSGGLEPGLDAIPDVEDPETQLPTFAPVTARKEKFHVRSPLSTVTIIHIPTNGSPVKIGRSSKSSHVALSRNKLVSRVHIKARYDASAQVLSMECVGWNGMTVIVPTYANLESVDLSKGYPTAHGQNEYPITKGQTIHIDYVPGISLDIRGERALVELVDRDDETEDEGYTDARDPTQSPNANPQEKLPEQPFIEPVNKPSMENNNSNPMTQTVEADEAVPEPNTREATVELQHTTGATELPETMHSDSAHKETEQVINPAMDASDEQMTEEMVEAPKGIASNLDKADAPKDIESSLDKVETQKDTEHKAEQSKSADETVDNIAETQNESVNKEKINASRDLDVDMMDEPQKKTENTPQLTSQESSENKVELPKTSSTAKAPEEVAPTQQHKAREQTEQEKPVSKKPKANTSHVAKKSKTPASTEKKRPLSPVPDSVMNKKKSRKSKEPTPDLKREPSPEPMHIEDEEQIKNVIANYLAFSRLNSNPLSTIRSSNNLLRDMPRSQLREVLGNIPCVGVIPRDGKDAAGKPLEEEYFYMPENDDDDHRKSLVQNSRGGGGLRSCRRTHKQYFWKKPTR
uniref:ARAD1A09394p n=1 Tax=Blastobotrys adeninivorans TaxID=409370 RepID=A0A060SXH0_BLAAD